MSPRRVYSVVGTTLHIQMQKIRKKDKANENVPFAIVDREREDKVSLLILYTLKRKKITYNCIYAFYNLYMIEGKNKH